MSDAPLDKDALFELVDEDRAFLSRLINTFLEDCTDYMAAIRQAVEQEDADALVRAAHGLKGAVSNLQAASAQRAARRLEKLGRSGKFDDVGPALEELEEEIRRLRGALEELTDEH